MVTISMGSGQSLVLVLFGATGDLAHRKLLPALYALRRKRELTEDLALIGVGRRALSHEEFRADMARTLKDHFGTSFDVNVWEGLARRMTYQQGFFEDQSLYQAIRDRLERIDEKRGVCSLRFLYLATPPVHYETILSHLDASGLSRGCIHGEKASTRILIEKPFGKDRATAKLLESLLSRAFDEEQIYRIDHYLGKETVQNMLSFRFANGIFEPTWHQGFVDHVQISLLEKRGVGRRGVFYEGVGALRDVVQNHLLQILALTAMEQPRAFDAESIRSARAHALASIRQVKSADVSRVSVRGQYDGYREEPGVEANSQTETYVCLKLFFDTPRWKGVPFYLRTGKRLDRAVSEISLHYKKPVTCVGDVCLFQEKDVLRNVLSIRIQPDDGISLRLMVKEPGFVMKLSPAQMNFHYRDAFPDFAQPEAYEKLLLDAIRGDQMLFARTDGIQASWQVITAILEGWAEHKPPVYPYAAGSPGPDEAERFIRRDRRQWFLHAYEL